MSFVFVPHFYRYFTMLLDSNKESYMQTKQNPQYANKTTFHPSQRTIRNQTTQTSSDAIRHCNYRTPISTRHRVRSKHARPGHNARGQAHQDTPRRFVKKSTTLNTGERDGDTNHAGAGRGSSRRERGGGGVAREGGESAGPGQGSWRRVRAGEGEGQGSGSADES
jgi:hypothetical protein